MKAKRKKKNMKGTKNIARGGGERRKKRQNRAKSGIK